LMELHYDIGHDIAQYNYRCALAYHHFLSFLCEADTGTGLDTAKKSTIK
jgi:hypothetical protein